MLKKGTVGNSMSSNILSYLLQKDPSLTQNMSKAVSTREITKKIPKIQYTIRSVL